MAVRPGSIRLDDLSGDRAVGRLVSDGRLDDEDGLPNGSIPRLVSWPRLNGGVRSELSTSVFGPSIAMTAVAPWSLNRRPPWRG